MRQNRYFALGAALAVLAVFAAAPALGADPADPEGLVPAQLKARSQVMPYYPATATLSRAQATVTLVAAIDADGRVDRTEVLGCDSPGFGFEESATEAVENWRFRPARQGDEAVASTTLITLRFAPPQRGNRNLDGAGASAMLRPLGTSDRYNAMTTASKAQGGFDDGSISTTALGSGQQAPTAVQRPPCGRGSGRCMYDRSLLTTKPTTVVSLPSPAGGSRR